MSLASSVSEAIWFLGHVSSQWPPLPAQYTVTNLLSVVRYALGNPSFPPKLACWDERFRVERTSQCFPQEPGPGPSKTRYSPLPLDKEGNSEVLLNLLFKTQNVSAPKTTGFLFGGRKMPFKEKEYTLQISLEGKSVGETMWVSEDFSTGFPPKRLPVVEQRWPAECPVSGSIRLPHLCSSPRGLK